MMDANCLTIGAICGRLSIAEGLHKLRIKGEAPIVSAMRPSASLYTHTGNGCFAFISSNDDRECREHSQSSNQFASGRCKLAVQKLSVDSDSGNKLVISTRRNDARVSLSKSVGRDKIAILVMHPEFIRTAKPDIISLVDLMEVFSDSSNEPRQYWNQEKKRLLGKDRELSQSLGQLKLPSWKDGKLYKTETAPLWACLKILARLDTQTSNDFINAIFQDVARTALDSFSAAELNYRIDNILHGAEWAADGIHKQLENKGLLNDPDLFERPKSYLRGGDR